MDNYKLLYRPRREKVISRSNSSLLARVFDMGLGTWRRDAYGVTNHAPSDAAPWRPQGAYPLVLIRVNYQSNARIRSNSSGLVVP